MILQDKMIWSEGMFLMPQHFQQQDRFAESMILHARQAAQPYFWGIQEISIDTHLLALGQFSITHCRGVLPDGTPFAIPERDVAPPPLLLAPGLSDCTIYLGVSLQLAGKAEINEQFNEAYRYHVHTHEVHNCNAGQDKIASLPLAKLSLRLLTEKDNRQGLSCLAIAKITEVRANQQIILNEDFFPASLNLQAIPPLVRFLQEIKGLLRYRGDMLAERLTTPGAGGVAEVTDFMLLQLINRYEPLMAHVTHHSVIHPEIFYQLLLNIIGELATFTQKKRRVYEQPRYLHNELAMSFLPLMVEIRRALSLVSEENAVALTLTQQSNSLWSANISDKTLLTTATFILAVHASLSQEILCQQFPAQVKVAPVEEIRQLVHRALPGMDLFPLSVVPREIPYHANYVYFTVNRAHALWDKLNDSASLALHIGGDFPDLRMELWAIKNKKD